MLRVIGFIFASILVVMLMVTIRASLYCPIYAVPQDVVRDPWFQATLVDAYCGFLTFFVWVAYREQTPIARVMWFVAIMGLGNMAMAAYVLWQLYRLPAGATMETLLLRPQARNKMN